MGIFNRLSNIARSKMNNAIDKVENPIELLDQKIRDMEESLNKAKMSSAQILGNVHEIEKKMKEAKDASNDFDEKVKLALNKGNEDLAKLALQKKLDEDKKYNSLKLSYDESYKKAQTIKKSLNDLEEELQKTRNYRDEAAARYSNAEASEKVNEILDNVQTKNNKINIDDIERKIEAKESYAEGLEDLKGDDNLDKAFEKLDDVNIDSELEKYKEKQNK